MSGFAEEDLSFFEDTLTDNFHNYLPEQKISYNNLGYMNPGTPFIQSVYSQQAATNSFWFFNNYTAFIQNHDDIVYFDAKKPFTVFSFGGGASNQELVNFLHTQNITPSLNFAFNYKIINSDGHYLYNKAKVNALSLNTAYTKHKYQSHFNFIYNKINHDENGGIKSDTIFRYSNISTSSMDVNLNNATNTISQIGFQYNHEYRFGSFSIDTLFIDKDSSINKIFNSNFSINQDFKVDRFYRIYRDIPSDFYATNANDTLTYDSISYKQIEHNVYFNFNFVNNKYKIQNFKLLAGMKNLIYNYFNSTFMSHYVTGKLVLETAKNSFYGNVNYCFVGTDIFDLDATIDYSREISSSIKLNSNLSYSLANPSLFMYYYRSNNFNWENNPNKTNKLSANLELNIDKWNFSIGSNFNLISNYFIFDTFALPQQISSPNIIADAYIKKLLKFGKFRWYNEFTYQYISDRKNLPLPEFVAYSNFYFQSYMFSNALFLQLGIDAKFHTSIYGYAYMPSTGAFYLQNNERFGNYPYACVYGSVKIKRLRGFVKLSNFNSTFMIRNYYLLYKIPDNPMSFNFGISWEFYD